MKRLYRSTQDKKIAGICGGLGEYFDLDPTLVRFLLVLAIFITGGLVIPAYLIGIWIIPNDSERTEDESI
ncbi:MAG: PspC domain-containing protein [Candidatus Latescibacteria bacterium]|nr:PspC domain-containing protein [Candidatus Latescibacterota bacterium]